MYLGLVQFGCLVAKLQCVVLFKKTCFDIGHSKVWHTTEWQGRLRGFSCQLERMVVGGGLRFKVLLLPEDAVLSSEIGPQFLTGQSRKALF